MRVCAHAEFGAVAFETEIGTIQFAGLIDVAARAEKIDLVESIGSVPAGIAVIAGVEAIDQQAAVR